MADNYVEIRIKASDTAKPDLTELKAELDELGHKAETAKVSVDDAEGKQKLLDMNAKLASLNQRVANPRIKVAGAARAEAEIAAVKHELDKLDDKAKKDSGGGGLLGKLLSGVSGASGKGGPAWLAPLVGLAPAIATLAGVAGGAAIGLGGAFAAGAGGLAAFGAVAKPVLSQALQAEQKVQAAQTAYNIAIANGAKHATAYRAEQIAIGKAYAEMSPAQIQLSKQLGDMANQWQNVKASFTPLIASALQPWLQGITTGLQSLGSVIAPVGGAIRDLGGQFATLMTSSTFRDFATWMGKTGATVIRSFGNALMDLLTGLTFILPQFTSLITGAAGGISKWGDAFVKWASSKKAADEIHNFLQWFHDNGPAVTGFLKNIGGALKALTPGLAKGGASELNILSGFFGVIAKLPPGVATPLAEVAGVLLTLNKLGVVNVGLKIGGKVGGKLAKTAFGEALLSGAGSLVLPVTLTIAALTGLSMIKDKKKGGGSLLAPKSSDLGLNGSWARDIAHWFDIARHEVSAVWSLMWHNTVDRARRGVDDVFRWVSSIGGKIASFFSSAGSWLVQHGKDILNGLWNGLKGAWGWVSGWFGRIYGWVTGVFSSAGSWLYNAGRSVISGLISGIQGALGGLGSVLGSVGSFIIQHKGPPSKDRMLLFENGQLIMQGLSGGIRSGLPGLHSTLTGVTGAIQGGVRPGAGAGGGGQVVIHIAPGAGGGGLDALFWTWLKAGVRVQGGDPAMFQRKVAYS